jgi:hypothetical protein
MQCIDREPYDHGGSKIETLRATSLDSFFPSVPRVCANTIWMFSTIRIGEWRFRCAQRRVEVLPRRRRRVAVEEAEESGDAPHPPLQVDHQSSAAASSGGFGRGSCHGGNAFEHGFLHARMHQRIETVGILR